MAIRIQLDRSMTSLEVLARAIMRETGSPKVLIDLPDVYVQHADQTEVERYVVPEHTQLILEALDRGEPITEGIPLHLMAPDNAGEEVG